MKTVRSEDAEIAIGLVGDGNPSHVVLEHLGQSGAQGRPQRNLDGELLGVGGDRRPPPPRSWPWNAGPAAELPPRWRWAVPPAVWPDRRLRSSPRPSAEL